jgi:hypothetical protein
MTDERGQAKLLAQVLLELLRADIRRLIRGLCIAGATRPVGNCSKAVVAGVAALMASWRKHEFPNYHLPRRNDYEDGYV